MNRKNFLKACIGLPFLVRLGNTHTMPTTKLMVATEVSHSPSVDHALLLDCIAQVETGGDDSLLSSTGARSKYQLTQAVWKQYSSLNFEKYCYGYMANQVATRHIYWLAGMLDMYKWRTFPEYPIAWCWKGGLNSWANSKSDKVVLNNYAVRVTNLYADARRGK